MKKQTIILSALFLLTFSMSSCAAVEGIFKAGMIWGIIIVLLVIVGLIYLFTRGGKK